MLAAAACLTATAEAQSQQIAKLTRADDAQPGENFGYSVSIDDGTIVVGAPNGLHVDTPSGLAHVYRPVDGRIQQVALLHAEDAAAWDNFGISVSISGDTILIGADHDNEEGDGSRWTGEGAAYIFREVNGRWVEIAKLVADDGAPQDGFGHSVAISGDTAVIGAYLDDDPERSSGSAYVFREIDGQWQQVAKLRPADQASIHNFGTSVAISEGTILVGTPARYENGVPQGGVAYVFREIDGQWQQVAMITSPDLSPGDDFGASVAIEGDTAVVARTRDRGDPGSDVFAYVFREHDGVWEQLATLGPGDGVPHSTGWISTSISGSTVIVGDTSDDGVEPGAGAAFVFREQGNTWALTDRIVADDGNQGDRFGSAVGIAGDLAVVGAWLDDDVQYEAGSAYVFWLGTPCPADLDGDGDADSEDLFAFLDAFAAGDLALCDRDGDGDCDADDFFTYLNLYMVACQ